MKLICIPSTLNDFFFALALNNFSPSVLNGRLFPRETNYSIYRR